MLNKLYILKVNPTAEVNLVVLATSAERERTSRLPLETVFYGLTEGYVSCCILFKGKILLTHTHTHNTGGSTSVT